MNDPVLVHQSLKVILVVSVSVMSALMIGLIVEEFMRNVWPRWNREEKNAFVAVTLLTAAIVLFGVAASSHAIAADRDGRHATSPLKKWFDNLASKRGSCCSDADGFAVSDADWETKDGKFRVKIKDQWHDVPQDALITVPNLAGRTMVWPIDIGPGQISIRCFMPGPMT